MGLPLCFYVLAQLGAFLPSIPGWCRDADPGIKTSPVCNAYVGGTEMELEAAAGE